MSPATKRRRSERHTPELFLNNWISQYVLLAHIGSFVPAARATIGPIDRILTRIGAGDDLARGQSTFMVEKGQ